METIRLRIAGVVRESIVDGPGLRHTVFCQGCEHACPGCHNPETWDLQGGETVDGETLLQRIPIHPLISGITFSGGEPFLQAPAVAGLAAYFKKLGLNIWVYTGYRWEDLMNRMDQPGYRELLSVTDVLVDGPFIQSLRTTSHPFRGSSNQRLIAVAQSLDSGAIVEWQP